jgi:toxin ParE1/3/4
MATVRRSPLAEQDYRDIWRYIANDNPDAADRLLQRIDAKLELYASNPRMGAMRDNLAQGLRSFPVGNYLAFYRITTDGIELVRMLHGARDLQTLLGSQNLPDKGT